jgi:Na+-transporting NADH:ubiquinone oxidoreductase subunit C
MMREREWFPIFYMFLVTAFFSAIIIGFTRFTSERVEANEELAFEKAVLAALPGLYDKTMSRADMHRTFVDTIQKPDASTAGAYTYRKNNVLQAYALPVSGQGFWAPIKGIIGIKADKKTITGIAFYEQNETPGLGAEITQPAFRNQFEGKVLAMDETPLSIKRPSASLGENAVHAVTGATQTSNRLEKLINNDVKQWRETMQKPDSKSNGNE